MGYRYHDQGIFLTTNLLNLRYYNIYTANGNSNFLCKNSAPKSSLIHKHVKHIIMARLKQ